MAQIAEPLVRQWLDCTIVIVLVSVGLIVCRSEPALAESHHVLVRPSMQKEPVSRPELGSRDRHRRSAIVRVRHVMTECSKLVEEPNMFCDL